MKKLRSEKGVITMITLITIIFMISFLITTYIVVANKVKTQKEMLVETKSIYEPKQTMEEIYNSFISNEEIIPIYEVEQLLAIGSGEQININGKIYTFLDTKAYILMANLEFDVDNWDEVLGENTDWTPIDETNFIFDWNGHTITVTKLDNTTVTYGVKQVTLPDEYQQVEYIESTGTQYIDTGIMASEISKIEESFQFSIIEDAHQGVFGRWTSNNTSIQMIYNGSSKMISLKWLDVVASIPADLEKHNIELSNEKIVIDNEIKEEYDRSNSTDNDNFVIFARRIDNSGAGIQNYSNMKIYSFKITTESGMVLNFIPCYRKSDNKPGLYDIVNDQFYTNAGSGDDFSIGNEV